MFWRVTSLAQSPVEAILDRGDFTLADLLDEDDAIQEARALNGRLVSFLAKRETVRQLIDYIVEPPPAGSFCWGLESVFLCAVLSLPFLVRGNTLSLRFVSERADEYGIAGFFLEKGREKNIRLLDFSVFSFVVHHVLSLDLDLDQNKKLKNDRCRPQDQVQVPVRVVRNTLLRDRLCVLCASRGRGQHCGGRRGRRREEGRGVVVDLDGNSSSSSFRSCCCCFRDRRFAFLVFSSFLFHFFQGKGRRREGERGR